LLTTLDPLAAMAEADPLALGELLGSIETSSAAVREFLEETGVRAGIPRSPTDTDPDEVPELPAEPVSKPGDIWTLGDHRLMCGDATDPDNLALLMEGEQADLLWTDPPYGVSYVGRTADALTIDNDDAAGLDALLEAAFATIDPHLRAGAALYVAHPAGPHSLIFGGRFVAQGWRYRQTLVWVKDSMVVGHNDYHYQHEPLLYGHKPGVGRLGRGGTGWYGPNDQTSVFLIPRPKVQREHPTAKPVELIRRCILNSSMTGDRILDPFLGSGSTLIACERFGRRGFGMEIDPVYCDVAVSRWEIFTGGKATRGRRRHRA
jgi:DNA modification methylase